MCVYIRRWACNGTMLYPILLTIGGHFVGGVIRQWLNKYSAFSNVCSLVCERKFDDFGVAFHFIPRYVGNHIV